MNIQRVLARINLKIVFVDFVIGLSGVIFLGFLKAILTDDQLRSNHILLAIFSIAFVGNLIALFINKGNKNENSQNHR